MFVRSSSCLYILSTRLEILINHSELLSQAKEEQQQLKDKLMEMLKETEYQELARISSEKAESSAKTFAFSPLPIFVG